VPSGARAIEGESAQDSSEADGCATCNSPDIRYVLVTDGPAAFTRMSFCSVDCLAKQLGLVRASSSKQA
jgi:hypothetical protein